MKKQLKKATNGLTNGQIYWARAPSGLVFIGIVGRVKKNIMLKNGNNLNAVLDFWNINENKYEYPINDTENNASTITM